MQQFLSARRKKNLDGFAKNGSVDLVKFKPIMRFKLNPR